MESKEWTIRVAIALASCIVGAMADARIQGQRIDRIETQVIALDRVVGRIDDAIQRLERVRP